MIVGVRCMLLVVRRLMVAAYVRVLFVLFVMSSALCVVCCLSLAVCGALFVVGCLSCVVWCLCAVCCLTCAGWWLSVVY